MSKPTSTDRDGPARRPDHITRGLVRLMMAVDDAYTDVSREVGLTAQQAQLLCAAQRPAPVGDLAAFLHCDRSNVSHLVDRAANRGLVRRRASEADGRVKLIELSADGEDLVERFVRTLGSRFDALLADWPADRRDQARETLHALAETLEQGRNAPPGPPPIAATRDAFP